MKHHHGHRTFGRPARQRTALLRGLARALILEGRIQTTEAKAKELRPFVEKLVTLARENTPAGRRLVLARLGGSDEAMEKLFEDVAPKYKDRQGGYTRILKMPVRQGDAASLALIEFV